MTFSKSGDFLRGLAMLTISVMGLNQYWPSQSLYIERVKTWAAAQGYVTPRGAVQIPIVARLFNISETTLRQSLHYKSKRRLGFDTLVHIAKTIGCNLHDLTGAAGAPPPGIAESDWGKIPEGDRLFVSTVLDDVVADTLSSMEKAELFGIYKEAKARMIRMRK
jgi:hypothetical protein